MKSPSNGKAVAELEPRSVWEYFAGIAAVPRPSKQEQRIRKHVKELLERRGVSVVEDRTGNLVATVPATPGHTDAPITVLQSHLDMVCEQNAGTQHDFDKEGIRLLVETEAGSEERIVRADGTTLGADNGIGAAMALAVATSSDVVHGPLELLFTIDEEAGMTGAKALTPESFRGRQLLNLDSEEDDAIYIGCAGGCDTNLAWTFDTSALSADARVARVNVAGLRGGHSGCEIQEGRGNAIKLLVRTLSRAATGSLQLISLSGGSKRNAIPREATAVVAGSSASLDALEAASREVATEAIAESFEPAAAIAVERLKDGAPSRGLTAADTERLLTGLIALPSGVLGMHPKVEGLVETSNNVSTMTSRMDGSQVVVEVGTLSRSSSASRLHETLDQLAAIGTLAGARRTTGNEYPGWSPNPDSKVLAVCRRVYRETFGNDPKVMAIHAGLECGIIGQRVGVMDMVSFGPNIRGAHSPDERVYVASVARMWGYLKAVLAAMAKG